MNAATMKQRLDEAEIINIWPVPDMSLVNNGRRPAVPMPSELFGSAWSVICDVAEVTSTAPDYAAMAYLASAASLIGGKRWVRPYDTGDWKEPAILWCAALGDPSSRKSSPLDMMTKPLWLIKEAARDDHDEAMRQWATEVERAKAERTKWQEDVRTSAGTIGATPVMPELAVEPEKPQERCPIISDVTPEAAAMVLSGNPQGVLCYNDELQLWLDGFDRYAVGGRPFWLSAFGGRPHSVTRKGSGSIFVKFNGISVLGSIQPDKLIPILDGGNDGLIPRILWAWPEKLPPRRPSRRADLELLGLAYRRLDSLLWGTDEQGKQAPVVLVLDDDAANLFHEWEVENASSDGEGGSLYETFVGKMTGAVLRLALISEMTVWAFEDGPEPRSVSRTSLAAAIRWVEDYAKPMTQRVYGDAAVSVADRNAALLARYIRKHRLDVVNMRALRLHPHKQHLKPLQAKIQGRDAMADAFEVLEDSGWIMPAFNREGDNAGRHKKDYRINPAVHGDRK